MTGVPVNDVACVSAAFWVDTFQHCHSVTQHGIVFHGWPDGGCLLEQEEFLAQSFGVIKDEMRRVIKEAQKKHDRQRN